MGDRRLLETLAKRLKRAEKALDSTSVERGVHDARRRLKKARAALRLLAPGLPRKRRKKVDRLCREAGRALAPARDGAALEAAWAALRLGGHGASTLRRRRRAAESAARARGLESARGSLRKARRAAARLELERGRACERGRRKARERLESAALAARRGGGDESFHEWRKRAKDERYQLELLGEEAARARGLKRLTDLLGEDHDLGVLAAAVAADPAAFGGLEAAARAQDAIAARRGVLRRRALSLPRI
jgi:CHAD domain-containing protein